MTSIITFLRKSEQEIKNRLDEKLGELAQEIKTLETELELEKQKFREEMKAQVQEDLEAAKTTAKNLYQETWQFYQNKIDKLQTITNQKREELVLKISQSLWEDWSNHIVND
ncbi:MAG TPA: hypothetical protein PLQ36_02235 [Candidatus Gracilibacteria bacterium]|nr:hypothetical protein [Candidatus Gracilibacteria bacterium]